MSASNKNGTASKATAREGKQAGKGGKGGKTAVPSTPDVDVQTMAHARATPASARGKRKGVERSRLGLSSVLPHEPGITSNPSFNPTLDDLLKDGGVPSVFLDANILIPQYLRSVFLDLSFAGLFVVHWSKSVLDETRRNLVDPHGHYALLPKGVDKTLKDMAKAFPHAVVHGSERYDAAFSGRTDAKDQHVAAGALKVSRNVYGGQAVVLVTSNAKDLPQWAFNGSQVLMVRPDLFLATLLKHSPEKAVTAINKMLARFEDPPTKQEDLLNVMVGAGCPQFAAALATIWGYKLENSLTPARQKQLPKALKSPPTAKTASAKKPAKRAPVLHDTR